LCLLQNQAADVDLAAGLPNFGKAVLRFEKKVARRKKKGWPGDIDCAARVGLERLKQGSPEKVANQGWFGAENAG
jgi:hypothetical protein